MKGSVSGPKIIPVNFPRHVTMCRNHFLYPRACHLFGIRNRKLHISSILLEKQQLR